MQKILFSLIVLLAAFMSRAECQQMPTVYPGAVPMTPEDENRNRTREQYANFRYLTRDSYSKVWAYYASENNKPRSEKDEGENGRHAFFSYVRRMPDDAGVSIAGRQGRSRIPNEIFSKLNGLVIQGVITDERAKEVENKYRYLENCYFVQREDDNGDISSVDNIIFRKYNREFGITGSGPMNQDEMIAQAHELISAGRMKEGAELMKMAAEKQIAGMQFSMSEDVVDKWVECLEEIAANAYSVIIHFSL
jgi:hypothetical protein